MVFVAQPEVDTAGVYAALRRHFEEDLQAWLHYGGTTRAEGDYPRRRILGDLRAGRTVNTPADALPKTALDTAQWRPGPPHPSGPRQGLPTRIYPARAIVTPDDQITFTEQDAVKLWLAENAQ